MESNSYIPMRAVIRCKAKMQLLADMDSLRLPMSLDETLLEELATTLLQSRQYQTSRRQYRLGEDAATVEDQIAKELVQTYHRIKLQQDNSMVQRLNALL